MAVSPAGSSPFSPCSHLADEGLKQACIELDSVLKQACIELDSVLKQACIELDSVLDQADLCL